MGGEARAFLRWVDRQARHYKVPRTVPRSLEDWDQQRRFLRGAIFDALGQGLHPEPCDLKPEILGAVERHDYRLERLIFQSRPAVWVTANAYVPAQAAVEKVPAVLSVHGHWRYGRIDPVPQARALGLVKLGYFVLAVDTFGGGERALDPLEPEYHGGLLGATTWPIGYPLLALELYDNLRAVDYLLTRSEVDPARLAVTGASGGGNQSMYVGAWDERIRVVVPVCSVGNYRAYLGTACCVGEVLPGALSFCEEGEILALIAPRPLLVISASQDARQFSPVEAAKSVGWAREIYRLHGAEERIGHAVVDAPHGYDRRMRELMYAWLHRWLKGGDAAVTVPEPEFSLEELKTLRCFPDGKRPPYFFTQLDWVAHKWRGAYQQVREPDHLPQWEAEKSLRLSRLERILALPRRRTPPGVQRAVEQHGEPGHGQPGLEKRIIQPEEGLELVASCRVPSASRRARPVVVWVDPGDPWTRWEHPIHQRLSTLGLAEVTFTLPATGALAVPNDRIADAVDHNSCQWSIWIGRPLLGLWVLSLQSLLDTLCEEPPLGADQTRVILAGVGAGGLAAVLTAARDERVYAVASIEMLASFATAERPQGHRMVYFVPHLATAGDLPHLAALVAPRRLLLVAPRTLQGRPLGADEAARLFAFTRKVYALYGLAEQLRIHPVQEPYETIATQLAALAT
jgi:dienelactone hydrolase